MMGLMQWAPEERLARIIEKRLIHPVFQPVVSLRDGKTIGYEALSRVTEEGVFDNIEEMFQCAESCGEIWHLEQVCRRAILASVSRQNEYFEKSGAKLFINVNPKVLYDEKFKAGFTKEYTRRYGIDADRIVIEVTERQRIEDEVGFVEAVNHYKTQNYQIAIDDMGSGYSGLKRVCMLSPNYIKLDMDLIRDVHKNPTKLALIKGLVDFSVNSGTMLIAEGIETKKELEVLISLGVQYGQGFYLGMPEKNLHPCTGKAYQEILLENSKKCAGQCIGEGRDCIKSVTTKGITVSPHVKVEKVLSYLEKNEDAIGICVLDGQHAVGTMTREKLQKKLSGRYGFSLYGGKEIGELADSDFLQVEGTSSISNVANMAMEREKENLYDFIVVKENGQYLGIVTVQDLLQRAMKINVELAKSSNPLTGLPGNVTINQQIKLCVESGDPYTIYYFDLDNFKAFNDVYGFEKGDEVIRILADILREKAGDKDFVGHIGGDDFVMICSGYQTSAFAEEMRIEFEKRAQKLYKKEHREQNFIIAKNRHGVMESFPLVSVTIVSLSNQLAPFAEPEEVTEILSAYKKRAKVRKRSISS